MKITPPLPKAELGTHDIVVAIPAFNEPEASMLQTLQALLRQKNIEAIRTSLLVMINNRPDAPAPIVEQNKRTYEAIMTMIGYELTTMPLHILDLYSEGNAQEGNNVGMARRMGDRKSVV